MEVVGLEPSTLGSRVGRSATELAGRNTLAFFVPPSATQYKNRFMTSPPDCDATFVVGGRRSLRLQDRLHHRAHHHRLARPRRRRHRRLLLAHGLQEEAEDGRAAAAPARVPQPAVHDAGTVGGTDARLPSLKTETNRK